MTVSDRASLGSVYESFIFLGQGVPDLVIFMKANPTSFIDVIQRELVNVKSTLNDSEKADMNLLGYYIYKLQRSLNYVRKIYRYDGTLDLHRPVLNEFHELLNTYRLNIPKRSGKEWRRLYE
jgi:hypothetical protein